MKLNWTTGAVRFESAPLITPERLQNDWRNVFATLPEWACQLDLVHDDEDESAAPVGILCQLSPNPQHRFDVTPQEMAVLMELTCFGASTILMNSNGKGRDYVRMSFRDAPEDLVTVIRILGDAGDGQQITPVWQRHKITTEHTANGTHQRAKWEARAIAIHHAKTRAIRREREGALPSGFSVTTYLENIGRLFKAIDRLRDGEEV